MINYYYRLVTARFERYPPLYGSATLGSPKPAESEEARPAGARDAPGLAKLLAACNCSSRCVRGLDHDKASIVYDHDDELGATA